MSDKLFLNYSKSHLLITPYWKEKIKRTSDTGPFPWLLIFLLSLYVRLIIFDEYKKVFFGKEPFQSVSMDTGVHCYHFLLSFRFFGKKKVSKISLNVLSRKHSVVTCQRFPLCPLCYRLKTLFESLSVLDTGPLQTDT